MEKLKLDLVGTKTTAPHQLPSKAKISKKCLNQCGQDSEAFLSRTVAEEETLSYSTVLLTRQNQNSEHEISVKQKQSTRKMKTGDFRMHEAFCLLTSWRCEEWLHLLIRGVF